MAPMTEEVRSRRRVRFSATKDDEREEERYLVHTLLSNK